MKSPVTKKARADWFKNYVWQKFEKEYQKALTCGAFSNEDFSKDDFALCTIVLRKTAKNWGILSDQIQRLAANFEHF